MGMFHPVSRLARSAALLAVLLLWAACQREAPSLLTAKGGGGVFRVLLPAEPQELDPNSIRDEVSLMMAPNLYSRLMTLDDEARLHADLAESWDATPGGLAYTFHLRQGVRWHDGRPFQSADVRWTLEHRARRPSLAAEALRRTAAASPGRGGGG